MNTSDKLIVSDKPTAKSIFASKTFWGAVLAAITSLVPICVESLKARQFTADHGGQIVLILCAAGMTITGRVQAKAVTYTPNSLPGPNQSDFEK